jgi:hypothetical protein
VDRKSFHSWLVLFCWGLQATVSSPPIPAQANSRQGLPRPHLLFLYSQAEGVLMDTCLMGGEAGICVPQL